MLTEPGAASIGAVVGLIVVDRIIRERPLASWPKLRFAAWATTLAAVVMIETALFAGFDALVWLSLGAAVGGLGRMAMSRT
jgi:presenilin-like A22 family membrane protease